MCYPLYNITKPPDVPPGYLASVLGPVKMGISTKKVWMGFSWVQVQVRATSVVQLRMNHMHY